MRAIDTLPLCRQKGKEMIKALIQKFTDSVIGRGGALAFWGADFTENKERAKIFLLHGSPGVGKTCVGSS